MYTRRYIIVIYNYINLSQQTMYRKLETFVKVEIFLKKVEILYFNAIFRNRVHVKSFAKIFKCKSLRFWI